MTTPAQPGFPTDDPHQPVQHPQEETVSPAGATKLPSTVLIAVVIALALAAWQLWVGFWGLDVGHAFAKNPQLLPGVPTTFVKWMFGVIFGFVLALAIPLIWGAVQAYRGFGRVLTFAAWLYVVLGVIGLLIEFSDHPAYQDVLAILGAVAIIVLQRLAASKAYYAAHRR
jgi:hypothetical protein